MALHRFRRFGIKFTVEAGVEGRPRSEDGIRGVTHEQAASTPPERLFKTV